MENQRDSAGKNHNFLDSIAKDLCPFPPSIPTETHFNPCFKEIAEQHQKIVDKAAKEVEHQQELYSIMMNECSNPHLSTEKKMKGLMGESVAETGNLSPWSVNNQGCMMDIVSVHTQAQPTPTATIQGSCGFGCENYTNAMVVRGESSADVVEVIIKGATSHRADPGFPYKVYTCADFNELYSSCAADLHCKVDDIFLVLQREDGNSVRRIIINKDDKVASVPVWQGATVTIHAWDGVRNVDPRMIELKCSMDRVDNKKITKKLKFDRSTTLLDVKKEWCNHIQRQPETTYIMVFSSMHGEAGSLTLQTAKVKNGATLRTGSLDVRDYPGFAKDGTKKYIWA